MTKRPIDFAAIAGTILRDRSTPFGARFWATAEHDEAVDLLRSWLWHNLAIGGALAEAWARGNRGERPRPATPPPADR